MLAPWSFETMSATGTVKSSEENVKGTTGTSTRIAMRDTATVALVEAMLSATASMLWRAMIVFIVATAVEVVLTMAITIDDAWYAVSVVRALISAS